MCSKWILVVDWSMQLIVLILTRFRIQQILLYVDRVVRLRYLHTICSNLLVIELMLISSLNGVLWLRCEKFRHHRIRFDMLDILLLNFLIVERILIVIVHVGHDVGARRLRDQIVCMLNHMLHSLTLLVNRHRSSDK